MNRLPLLSDAEFDGTLMNALSVAADRYKENAAELREEARSRVGPTNEGNRHHFNQLAEQFDRQERETRALIEKLQEESVDA